MIKIIKEAQVRSEEDNRNLRETVAGIIGEVRGRGDAALREYNEKFDGCTRESLRVSREEIDAAYKELGEQELAKHTRLENFEFTPTGPVTVGKVVAASLPGTDIQAAARITSVTLQSQKGENMVSTEIGTPILRRKNT